MKSKKIQKSQLKTPLLFLVFNRLDTTKKVFAEIRKAKPRQFFIAADGPRKSEEKKNTDAVRKYIMNNINWPCKVKTLFRKKNLGCKYAVSEAITWFFENVEQGIILEDDTVPDQSFFKFCEELLEKYKDKEKIMSIAGYNYQGFLKMEESYYFSKYFECGGWASWKRAWKKYDPFLKKFTQIQRENKMKTIFPTFLERIIYSKRIKDALEEKVSSWAYRFKFAHFIERGYCIHPKNNMIKFLGFDERATHTKSGSVDEKFISLETKPIGFPLKHPKEIIHNEKIDKKDLKKEIKRILLKKIIW